MWLKRCSYIGFGVIISCLGATAQNYPLATIQVQCAGGNTNSQVAIRWRTKLPNDATPSLLPVDIFKVPCGDTQQPMLKRSISTTLKYPESNIEIQTEGGVMTAYNVLVTINSQKTKLVNYLGIDHTGSPSIAYTGAGFYMRRSSGPNKYGEQNYRVYLTGSPVQAQVMVKAQSTGDRSNAQMALRWGHPDFNDTSYFHLWTIKAGPEQTKSFTLSNAKSDFEIQTEGGEGTGYHVSMYLDVGKGMPTQPSILMAFNKPTTDFSAGYTDITFDEPNGNVYGEMTLGVHAPWIVPPATPGDNVGGLQLVYDYGTAPESPLTDTAVIRFIGSWIAGSAPVVPGSRTAFSPDISETVNGGQDNLFSHSEGNLQPGNWSIRVAPVLAGGGLGIISGCNINVSAGSAAILTISNQTHRCQ